MSIKGRMESSNKINILTPNQDSYSSDLPRPLNDINSLDDSEFDSLIRSKNKLKRTQSVSSKARPFSISSASNISKSKSEEQNEDFYAKAKSSQAELKNFLHIRIRTDLEKVDEFKDKYPLLELRRALLRIKHAISDFFSGIVSSKLFQIVVVSVILLNTVVLALENPTWTISPYPYNELDLFFAIFYTVEFGMVVMANGLFLNSNSYFREYWNFLDFTIIVTAWLSLYASSGFSLSSLRSLRILRPLRSISSIKGIKVLVLTLFNAIKPLLFSFSILFGYIFIFSIAAVQMWSGELRGRCMEIDTGIAPNPNFICGSFPCEVGQVCASCLDNPNYGTISFDNILISFVINFQIISLEGWSSEMEMTVTAFSYYTVFYYILLIFGASYVMVNFAMAIVAISFKNVSETIFQKKAMDEKVLVNENLLQKICNKSFVIDGEESVGKQTFDKTGKNEDGKVGQDEGDVDGKADICRNIRFDKEILDNANAAVVVGEDFEVDDQGNEFYDYDEIRFESDFAIDINSALRRSDTFNAWPVYARKATSVMSKKREPQSSLYSFPQSTSKVDLNQILTDIQPDSEYTLKNRQDFLKLKSVVTIKYKTLDYLKKNPNTLKNTRIELVEKYDLMSESSAEINPVSEKPGINLSSDFSYFSIDSKDPLIVHYYSEIRKVYQQYPEFTLKYELFNFLSLKFSPKDAFFQLVPNSKSLVYEKSQSFFTIQGDWSGLDIDETDKASNSAHLKSLSNLSYKLWDDGYIGVWQKIANYVKPIVMHKYTSYIMLAAVVANTVVLSLERYGISQTEENNLQTINLFFTYFFTCELFLKIVGVGLLQFIRDAMNILDSIVVLLSLIELFILSGGTSLTAFRAIRVFRVFRVLRILKIFRYVKSITLIVNAISRSLRSIFYLLLLLALFLIVFTLLGEQVYGGTFNFPTGLPRANFDTFHWAFVTTFQVLSVENWNDLLTSSLRSQAGPASCILLIVWIVLGNYILLNLFLAILLGSFNDVYNESIEGNIRKFNKRIQKKIDAIQQCSDSESENENGNNVISKKAQLIHLDSEKSFWLFSKTNPLRLFCFKLFKHPNFENFYLALIIANSIKLVWDTYILDKPATSIEYQVSNNLDYVFTAFYILEFLVKSIALGLYFDSDAYLRDNWNRLDFAIVVVSIIDLAVTSINLPVIKLFRLLRTLRPLKLIKHNISMKISVIALLESFVNIVNVMIVILMIWLMYAILGVSLLAGKMHKCTDPTIMDIDTCHAYGSEWKEVNFNFDNVLQAMVVLFIIMSQESWPNRMIEGVDASVVGRGPVVNYDLNMAYFYCVYLFISNFFLLKLFTVVIFNKFSEVKKNESSLSSLLLSKEQVLWSEVQNLILLAKPWRPRIVFHSKIRRKCYELSKNKAFEIGMMVIILINMISMSMNYYGASDNYNKGLEIINLICTGGFIAEATIKIVGIGLHYFKSNWNRFDFVIVVLSSLDIIYFTNTSFLRQGPQLARVFRVIRVFRLFRLIRAFESLNKLLMIMSYALPAIINVKGLILLIFFIYAVLGSFLFNSISTGQDVDYFFNFHNFHSGMILLWRMSTGEDYPILMNDFSIQSGSYGYYLFFITFIILSDFVILRLFISIVLQYFEEFYVNPYNPLTRFGDDLKVFKRFWIAEINEFAYKIDKEGLISLIGNCGVEFRFLKTNDKLTVAKLIGVMNIESDPDGKYYFNDVLYAILRRKYYKKINKREYRIDFAIMRAEEIKTRRALKKIRDKYIKLGLKQKRKGNSFLRREKRKSQVFERNMFFEALFLKSVFNSWKHYAANAEEYDKQVTPEDSDIEYPGDISLEYMD